VSLTKSYLYNLYIFESIDSFWPLQNEAVVINVNLIFSEAELSNI
jgi:hypothetical protein